jgi:hypothetical protein
MKAYKSWNKDLCEDWDQERQAKEHCDGKKR